MDVVNFMSGDKLFKCRNKGNGNKYARCDVLSRCFPSSATFSVCHRGSSLSTIMCEKMRFTAKVNDMSIVDCRAQSCVPCTSSVQS